MSDIQEQTPAPPASERYPLAFNQLVNAMTGLLDYQDGMIVVTYPERYSTAIRQVRDDNPDIPQEDWMDMDSEVRTVQREIAEKFTKITPEDLV